jgi:predicted DCC family thiol-disulfide oxidoreductase YuxK
MMATMPQVATVAPLLVYDGECGFCARSVQFILKHERRHDLLFVPRDSEFGKELRRRFHLEAVESMLWIEGDRAFAESDATLHAAQYVGGIWAMLARIARLIPASLRNLAYRFVARNRKKISAKMNVCLVPTAEQKLRFLSRASAIANSPR